MLAGFIGDFVHVVKIYIVNCILHKVVRGLRFIKTTRTALIGVIRCRRGGRNCNAYNRDGADARAHYDTEFNVDWFDQLIGYSPVSCAMWPCHERGHTRSPRITKVLTD